MDISLAMQMVVDLSPEGWRNMGGFFLFALGGMARVLRRFITSSTVWPKLG